MSFFESIPQPPPPPEPVRRRRPAWMRSDVVIPGPVPAQVVLVRTEQVAMAVGSIRAYPNGFEFTVHIRLRREDETGWPGDSDPFGRHRPRRGTQGDDDQLRLGILYADGRRAATTREHYRPPDDDDDGRLVLQQGGGGGDSSRGCDWDFWVHPLPPARPVILVASWLEHGIDESRAELDGGVIREAAQRAVTLWPEEPEFEGGASWRSETITAGMSDHLDAGAEPDRPGGADAGGRRVRLPGTRRTSLTHNRPAAAPCEEPRHAQQQVRPHSLADQANLDSIPSELRALVVPTRGV